MAKVRQNLALGVRLQPGDCCPSPPGCPLAPLFGPAAFASVGALLMATSSINGVVLNATVPAWSAADALPARGPVPGARKAIDAVASRPSSSSFVQCCLPSGAAPPPGGRLLNQAVNPWHALGQALRQLLLHPPEGAPEPCPTAEPAALAADRAQQRAGTGSPGAGSRDWCCATASPARRRR